MNKSIFLMGFVGFVEKKIVIIIYAVQTAGSCIVGTCCRRRRTLRLDG